MRAYFEGRRFKAKGVLFAIIFCSIGGFFSFGGIVFWLQSEARFLTVVDLKTRETSDGTSYIPVFQVLHDADYIRYGGNTSTSWKLHEIGDEVPGYHVVRTGELRSRKQLLTLSGFGAVFVVFGLVFGWPTRDGPNTWNPFRRNGTTQARSHTWTFKD